MPAPTRTEWSQSCHCWATLPGAQGPSLAVCLHCHCAGKDMPGAVGFLGQSHSLNIPTCCIAQECGSSCRAIVLVSSHDMPLIMRCVELATTLQLIRP